LRTVIFEAITAAIVAIVGVELMYGAAVISSLRSGAERECESKNRESVFHKKLLKMDVRLLSKRTVKISFSRRIV
jgi:hypothetical protein